MKSIKIKLTKHTTFEPSKNDLIVYIIFTLFFMSVMYIINTLNVICIVGQIVITINFMLSSLKYHLNVMV